MRKNVTLSSRFLTGVALSVALCPAVAPAFVSGSLATSTTLRHSYTTKDTCEISGIDTASPVLAKSRLDADAENKFMLLPVAEAQEAAMPVLTLAATGRFSDDIVDIGVTVSSNDAFPPLPLSEAEKKALILAPRNDFAAMDRVSDAMLGEIRGAAGTTITGAETVGAAISTAVAINNSADNSITGNNVITNGAFGASSGVAFVVQNSGNNSAINASLVVNLNLAQ